MNSPKRKRTSRVDVQVSGYGSIYGFSLLTKAAEEWVAEYVSDEAHYPGQTLMVEHHYAQHLARGMSDDGLVVR